MINKILVAVAGRGLCEEMLNMLLDIPSFKTASVTVLHVVPPQISSDTMSEKLEDGEKFWRKRLNRFTLTPAKLILDLNKVIPKILSVK